MHPASQPLETLARDCQVTRTKRGGPGGQHRNKVETAIVITHLPSKIRAQAAEERSQAQNLDQAWQRLRVQLALGIRSDAAAVSTLWQLRTRGGKLQVNPAHADFPALLAEALDVLATLDWDLPAAVERLGVTSSRLIKFLKLEPQALALLNNVRAARGQKPYH